MTYEISHFSPLKTNNCAQLRTMTYCVLLALTIVLGFYAKSTPREQKKIIILEYEIKKIIFLVEVDNFAAVFITPNLQAI